MQLITQQAWRTANTVSHAARRTGPAPGVELHHTVTARATSGDRLVAIARAIYGDHVGAREWADIFYGFLIGDTHVLEARGWDRLSGEIPSVVVAVVGDYRTGQDRLNDFQRDAILWARAELVARGGGEHLTWHSRRASTDCPGGHVIEFAESMIRNGTAPETPPPHMTPTDDQLRDERTIRDMDTLNLRGAADIPVRGRHVGNCQGLLMAAGYGPAGLVGGNGLPDGIAGRRTAECVEAFQRAHALVPDRIVGPATWRVLVTS